MLQTDGLTDGAGYIGPEERVQKIIVERRFKARRKGQGRKQLVDEEGERFLAKCEKATAPCRAQNPPHQIRNNLVQG